MFKNMNGTNYVEGVHYDLIKLSSGKLTKVGFEGRKNLGGRVDMHIHSNSSDGTLNPEEIIRLAILSNVSTFAITDHDTLLGTKMLLSTDDRGLEVYSGIELSALVRTGKERIHILGYDFDVNAQEINKAVEFVDKCSEYNFKLYIKCLEEEFPEIDIPKEDIEAVLEDRRKTGRNIGRVDIANILIRHGYANDPKHEYPDTYTPQDIVFEKYLNPVKYQVQEEKMGITEEECIKAIKESGGLVSLAHPSSLGLNDDELDERIKHYKELGLDGLEVYHPNNNPRQRALYYSLAKKYGLLVSGGTDYHGYEVKPNIILGHGKNGNVDIRENDISLVKALRKRR
ncbi:MAG: PHP domain-containing protein [Bacilli bacterium]|nr:PHP domain-containing protein [Bacilli bacterium]